MKTIKTKNKKIFIINLFLVGISIFFTNCIDDEYDLTNGVNTEISLGGDSLSIPVLQTTKIYLDSLMSTQDIEMLKTMNDSTYAFQIMDSMKMNFGIIDPFSITIPTVSISPINLNFSAIDLPTFDISPVNVEEPIKIHDYSLDAEIIQPIDNSYSEKFVISVPQYLKRNQKPAKSKSETVYIGPLRKTTTRTIYEPIYYSFPTGLDKINTLYFDKTLITLTFDKTITNQLNLSDQNDTIKEFRIDLPAEYKISTPIGMNARIEGNSFIIENAVLTKGVDVFTANFILESIDFSNIFQFENLSYNNPINYKLDYSFTGETNDIQSLVDSEIGYTINLKSNPVIKDADIVTKDIVSAPASGSLQISKIIENIPSEISEIKSITFLDNARVLITIPDPGLYPFTMTSGYCQIELPKSVIFKPFTGLNTTTNVLTIPYSNFYGTK